MKQIDTGRYTCVAVGHEIIEKEGQAPCVSVTLRVVEGPDTGRDIFWYGNLTEGQTQEYTAQALRAMGWRCQDITMLEGLGDLKVNLVGKAGANKKDPSKPYQNWMVFPAKVPQPRLADNAKASFAARFKSLAVSTPALEVSEFNAAPSVIPEGRSRNGSGASLPSDGPGPDGVPF